MQRSPEELSAELESLYALKEVDVRSIRPVSKEPPSVKRPRLAELPDQLDLPFPHWGCEVVDAFRLEEPVELLGLSLPAEKRLHELERFRMGHLLASDGLEGLVLGHQDEVERKLNEWRALSLSPPVVILRVLLGDLEGQERHQLLSRHQMATLIPRSVRGERKGSALRLEWAESALRQVADRWLFPWMAGLGGVVADWEAEERIEAINGGLDGERALRLIGTLCFGCDAPFELLLERGERGVWTLYPALYRQLLARALSYFYRPALAYPLPELVSYLERELSVAWIDFPSNFVERFLTRSPSFRARKGAEGVRLVTRYVAS